MAVTWDGIWSQAALAFKLMNATQLYGETNTPNVVAMEAALVAGLEGEFITGLLSAARSARRDIAAPLSASRLRATWRPVLQELCKLIGAAKLAGGSNELAMLAAVRDYMAANNEHIRARGMAFGSVSAGGSNVGDATIRRVTVDKNGWPLSTSAEAKSATVIRDSASGARTGAEVLLFEGEDRARDNLELRGSGLSREITTCHPLTNGIIRNPSFDSNGASADDEAPTSTTQVTGWVLTTAAKWKIRTASGYYFATYPGAPSTLAGLECEASDAITQTIRAGVRFRRDVPYYVAVRWKRLASATGTITLALGSKSAAATIGDGTNDQWNELYLALDEDAYFENFNQSSLALSITIASLATGTVVIDDVRVVEMVNVDGTFYAVPAGATPLRVNDEFTWTDSEGATRAIFALLLWLAYGAEGWLPSTVPATQVTAAGGRTLTYDQSSKTITASSGDFRSDGLKPGMTLTSAGTSNNNVSDTIASVTATVITLTADVLTDEGPLSSAATLNAVASIAEPS